MVHYIWYLCRECIIITIYKHTPLFPAYVLFTLYTTWKSQLSPRNKLSAPDQFETDERRETNCFPFSPSTSEEVTGWWRKVGWCLEGGGESMEGSEAGRACKGRGGELSTWRSHTIDTTTVRREVETIHVGYSWVLLRWVWCDSIWHHLINHRI